MLPFSANALSIGVSPAVISFDEIHYVKNNEKDFVIFNWNNDSVYFNVRSENGFVDFAEYEGRIKKRDMKNINVKLKENQLDSGNYHDIIWVSILKNKKDKLSKSIGIKVEINISKNIYEDDKYAEEERGKTEATEGIEGAESITGLSVFKNKVGKVKNNIIVGGIMLTIILLLLYYITKTKD